MKMLYITPWAPSLRSGGGRHCYANLRALQLYPGAIVDYIGPQIEEVLPDISLDKFRFVMARPFTIVDKVIAVAMGASTSLISIFMEFVRRYGVLEYDLVFVETTRCGFIFRIFNNRTPFLCSVHNVELDYMNHNARGSTWLAAKNIQKSEQQTLNKCQTLLVMHDKDEHRLRKLYHINDETTRIYLHPVCSLPPKCEVIPFGNRKQILVFIGSLDCKFNETGIKEFINRCWPIPQNSEYTLIIAGRSPSSDLSEFLSKQPRVHLIPNPMDMEPILRNAQILLLPDMTGTGMKLRVAEAMSLGVPIVGTKAGLYGYTNVPNYAREVENVECMNRAISELIANPFLLSLYSKAARDTWMEHYSIDVFTSRLHHIIDKVNKSMATAP